jgi:hypothetical protein
VFAANVFVQRDLNIQYNCYGFTCIDTGVRTVPFVFAQRTHLLIGAELIRAILAVLPERAGVRCSSRGLAAAGHVGGFSHPEPTG